MAAMDDLIATISGGMHVSQDGYDLKALQVSRNPLPGLSVRTTSLIFSQPRNTYPKPSSSPLSQPPQSTLSTLSPLLAPPRPRGDPNRYHPLTSQTPQTHPTFRRPPTYPPTSAMTSRWSHPHPDLPHIAAHPRMASGHRPISL